MPAIEADQVVTGSLDVAGLSALYAFSPPQTGLVYKTSLVSAPSNFIVRLLDADTLHKGKAWAGGDLGFESAESAPYYVQVQSSLTGERTGTFELALSYPLVIRGFEVDGNPAGWRIRWQGKTNAAYSLMGSSNLVGDLSVLQSNLTGQFNLTATGALSDAIQFFSIKRE